MRKFRVVRGSAQPNQKWAIGTTRNAHTAREAVELDELETNTHANSDGMVQLLGHVKPAPIIAVYEMIPVPEEEWK